MSDNKTFEGDLPNREPQAPNSIPVSQVDAGNPPPCNEGGEPHGCNGCVAGEPCGG